MDGFQNRWYLDPVYGRGYPQDMVDLLGDLSPQAQGLVLPGDTELMGQPTDFLGVNMYSRAVGQDAPGEGSCTPGRSAPRAARTPASTGRSRRTA